MKNRFILYIHYGNIKNKIINAKILIVKASCIYKFVLIGKVCM